MFLWSSCLKLRLFTPVFWHLAIKFWGFDIYNFLFCLTNRYVKKWLPLHRSLPGFEPDGRVFDSSRTRGKVQFQDSRETGAHERGMDRWKNMEKYQVTWQMNWIWIEQVEELIGLGISEKNASQQRWAKWFVAGPKVFRRWMRFGLLWLALACFCGNMLWIHITFMQTWNLMELGTWLFVLKHLGFCGPFTFLGL